MNYLFIANLSFTVFFAVYALLLKRLTFFGLNRVYLLFALVFSALSPFLSINLGGVADGLLPEVTLPMLVLSPGQNPSVLPMAAIFLLVYWSGVAVAAMLLFRALYRLWDMRSRLGYKTHADSYFVSEGYHAFSFFGRIEIGDRVAADMLEMILAHESVHQRQRHSADVLLFALARVFFWFNPLVHLAAREVQLNHEFLADRESLARFGTDYQHGLLNQALNTRCFPLTNSFFSRNTLKNRILMMNKKHSRKWSLAVYALVIPTVACSLWLSSCSDQAGMPDQNRKNTALKEVMSPSGNNAAKQSSEVDKKPEFPGGEEGLLTYFKEGFNYPTGLKEAGISGKCTLAFTVNEDGSISDVQAVQSDHEMLEAPAIAFVENMPDWTPGEVKGEKVKVKMHLPVMFTLN